MVRPNDKWLFCPSRQCLYSERANTTATSLQLPTSVLNTFCWGEALGKEGIGIEFLIPMGMLVENGPSLYDKLL